jgi:hypothetical protein
VRPPARRYDLSSARSKRTGGFSPGADGVTERGATPSFADGALNQTALSATCFFGARVIPAPDLGARAFDEKVESVMGDSHEGANQIQDPHWNKGGQS